MAGQIVFNSEEVLSAVNILNESAQLLMTNVKTSLGSDFTVLSELGFLSDGLSKLSVQADSLIQSHDNFMKKLMAHDLNLQELELNLETYAENELGNNSGGNADYSSNYNGNNSGSNGNYSGGSTDYNNIDVSDVNSGTAISDSVLIEQIPNIDYTTQSQVLKSLASNNEYKNLVSRLLLNPENSGVLVLLLKEMFGGNVEGVDTNMTETTNQIQKLLLEAFAKSENNVFASLEEATILTGIRHFNQIAKENNITVSELLLNEKYNTVFLGAVSDIYNGNNLTNSGISMEEITIVKTYLDDLAKNINVDVNTMLNDVKYVDVIKQGFSQDDVNVQPKLNDSNVTTYKA